MKHCGRGNFRRGQTAPLLPASQSPQPFRVIVGYYLDAKVGLFFHSTKEKGEKVSFPSDFKICLDVGTSLAWSERQFLHDAIVEPGDYAQHLRQVFLLVILLDVSHSVKELDKFIRMEVQPVFEPLHILWIFPEGILPKCGKVG